MLNFINQAEEGLERIELETMFTPRDKKEFCRLLMTKYGYRKAEFIQGDYGPRIILDWSATDVSDEK